MPHKILICGGNGAGKSTLGRALAQATGWPFRDVEDYYFPAADGDYKYKTSRTSAEVAHLLKQDLELYPDILFASVRGNYGADAPRMFTAAVWVQTPKEERMARVQQRSFAKFGERMLPGGDLHDQEQRFFALVQSRTEDDLPLWLNQLAIPVLRVDGRRPVSENVENILMFLNEKSRA